MKQKRPLTPKGKVYLILYLLILCTDIELLKLLI